MTDRRKYLLMMGLIALALAGSLLLAIPGSPAYKKPTLGLDLQGGLEVVLRAQPPKGQKVDSAGLTLSETGTPNAYYLFKTGGTKTKPTRSLKDGPTPTLKELLRRYGGKVPKGFEVLGEPAGTQVVSCAAQTGCIGAGRTGIKAAPTY